VTGAYERHENVNRQSDITAIYPSGNAYSQMLEAQNVAAEDAGKVGILYAFPSNTAIGGIFETMHRCVPQDLEFQNERQRPRHMAFRQPATYPHQKRALWMGTRLPRARRSWTAQ